MLPALRMCGSRGAGAAFLLRPPLPQEHMRPGCTVRITAEIRQSGHMRVAVMLAFAERA